MTEMSVSITELGWRLPSDMIRSDPVIFQMFIQLTPSQVFYLTCFMKRNSSKMFQIN